MSMQDSAPTDIAVVDDSSTEGEVEQPATESAETTETTGEDQATTQSEPQEDDILAKLETLQLDPTLKEELKKGYLRNADYTKKTQEIAEVRRLADEYRKVQPLVQKVMSDEALRNAALGIPQRKDQDIPDDPAEYARWVQEQTLAQVSQMFVEREQQAQVRAARDRDIAQAETVDARLNADPEFGQTIVGLVGQNPEFIAGRISATEATKQAIAFFDNYAKKITSTATNQLVQKAKAKQMTGVARSSPAQTGGGSPTNMREAAMLAEQQLEK